MTGILFAVAAISFSDRKRVGQIEEWVGKISDVTTFPNTSTMAVLQYSDIGLYFSTPTLGWKG